jgi:hypothetical protein
VPSEAAATVVYCGAAATWEAAALGGGVRGGGDGGVLWGGGDVGGDAAWGRRSATWVADSATSAAANFWATTTIDVSREFIWASVLPSVDWGRRRRDGWLL